MRGRSKGTGDLVGAVVRLVWLEWLGAGMKRRVGLVGGDDWMGTHEGERLLLEVMGLKGGDFGEVEKGPPKDCPTCTTRGGGGRLVLVVVMLLLKLLLLLLKLLKLLNLLKLLLLLLKLLQLLKLLLVVKLLEIMGLLLVLRLGLLLLLLLLLQGSRWDSCP